MTRRPALALAAVLVALSGCGVQDQAIPTCANGDALILVAQSVPSAAFVPCIQEFPAGWSFDHLDVRTGLARFWLNSDRAGNRSVIVTLAPSCTTKDAVEVEVDPDEVGTRRFEQPQVLPPPYVGDRFYLFPGGCITYHFTLAPGSSYGQVVEATQALSFVSRADGVKELARLGMKLCGAGVECPG